MPEPASIDVIDRILDVQPGSPIAKLRSQKAELARELQTYYDSLFAPSEVSLAQLTLPDRYLIAVRVATHTGSKDVVDWYANRAKEAGARADLIERALDLADCWTDSTRLGAAVRHADLLTTSPSHTSAHDLQALKDAGFSPAGIVTLSQVIAFVSYQLRLIAGLRALGGVQ